MFLAEYITSVTTWALATIQSKAAKLHRGVKDVVLFAHFLIGLVSRPCTVQVSLIDKEKKLELRTISGK